jgi:hypothetical protein
MMDEGLRPRRDFLFLTTEADKDKVVGLVADLESLGRSSYVTFGGAESALHDGAGSLFLQHELREARIAVLVFSRAVTDHTRLPAAFLEGRLIELAMLIGEAAPPTVLVLDGELPPTGSLYFVVDAGESDHFRPAYELEAILRYRLTRLPELAVAHVAPTTEAKGTIEVPENLHEIVDVLKDDPQAWPALSPRKFEELVAELLKRLGFITRLTPPTRDGGYDIRAVRKDGVGTLVYLVECKRYTPPTKVGVDIVRSFHSVLVQEDAHCGIIATTSLFTRPALQHPQVVSHRIRLVDLSVLRGWL